MPEVVMKSFEMICFVNVLVIKVIIRQTKNIPKAVINQNLSSGTIGTGSQLLKLVSQGRNKDCHHHHHHYYYHHGHHHHDHTDLQLSWGLTCGPPGSRAQYQNLMLHGFSDNNCKVGESFSFKHKT